MNQKTNRSYFIVALVLISVSIAVNIVFFVASILTNYGLNKKLRYIIRGFIMISSSTGLFFGYQNGINPLLMATPFVFILTFFLECLIVPNEEELLSLNKIESKNEPISEMQNNQTQQNSDSTIVLDKESKDKSFKL